MVLDKAKRILRMSWRELRVRARQEISKAAERFLMRLPALVPARSSPHPVSGVAPLPGLACPAAVARLVRDHYPQQVEETLAKAEQLLEGTYDLLGLGPLRLGPEPRWQEEPLARVVAPLGHWSRVDPLSFGEVGDSRTLWELNRHQFLVSLGQAYRLTEDHRYTEHAWRLVDSWIRENPADLGVNWSSSLELALRAIAWCWLWHLADGNEHVQPELAARFLSTLERHGRHIERYLSTYYSPNTHLTGEALGLCYLATCWPNLRRSRRWWQLGSEVMLAEMPAQIRNDGLHFERSSCYHLYTLDFYLHYALLRHSRSETLPDELLTGLKVLAEATVALQRPDGTLPNVGDDDGGRLIFLAGEKPLDPSTSLALASCILRDPGLWPENESAAGAVWAVGPELHRSTAQRARKPSHSSRSTVRCFQSSGFTVSCSTEGDYLLASSGIQDLGQKCVGHIHDDALSVEVWCKGQPVVIDPGTYTYTGDVQLRRWYRSASAHSSALVDGMPKVPNAGPFAWNVLTAGTLDCHVLADEYDYLELRRELDVGSGLVTHWRRVVVWRGYGLLIWDRFHGAGEHELTLRYQFPPGLSSLEGQRGHFHVDAAAIHVAGPRASATVLELIDSPISPRYGRLQQAQAAVVSARAELPADFITLILPGGHEEFELHERVRHATRQELRRVVTLTQRGQTTGFIVLQDPPKTGLWIGEAPFLCGTAWITLFRGGGRAARVLLLEATGTVYRSGEQYLTSTSPIRLGEDILLAKLDSEVS